MGGLTDVEVGPMFESFWNVDPTGAVTLLLGEAYEWSEDNLTLTVTLRQGVKFHDGTDFDAEAVKWNFDDRMPFLVDGSENIESYKIIDDYHFQITIKKFDNTWFRFAGLGNMISPTAVETYGEEYIDTHPVGTGPFKFKGYKENEYLEFERFDDYWGDRPYLDGIKYIYIANTTTAQLSFEAGEADAISVMSGGGKLAYELQQKGYKIELASSMSTMLIPSVRNPDSPLSNLKVRQAIEYAIDKVKITQTVGFGYYTPIYQYCGLTQPAYDFNFEGRVYDPGKARALLAEAGYADGFSTTIYASNMFAGDELVAIQSNLKDVNIDLDISMLEVGKWIEMETYGWDDGIVLSPTGLYLSYGDSTAKRYLIQPTEPNFVNGLYWDSLARTPEMEQLIQQYLVLTDLGGQEAIDIGRAITKEVFDNAAIIPIFEQAGVTVLGSWVHDRPRALPHFGYWEYGKCWMSSH
jgi:ABC-type transport system substrate-binding protein